jgi:4-diphosphocytidyl-2-C-methyl-D-erythritol kinase
MNVSINDSDSASITIDAPAKLTLSLRVTGVREDGFHLIDAEMVTLNLVDKVRITPDED